jgi:Phage minor structural protein GP20.
MTKEKLIAIGLTEEQATEAMKLLDDTFIPKHRFDEVNTKLATAETTIKERDNQLETLKKSTGDIDSLKQQITTLQGENKKKDEEHAQAIKSMKIDTAVQSALTNAKAKNLTAVKALLKDQDKFDLDDTGNVKGLSEQIKSLVKSEDTSFLFDSAEPQNQPQNFKGLTPTEKKDNSGMALTMEKIKTMSQEEIANNWDTVTQSLAKNK